jgi:hypothetical protein
MIKSSIRPLTRRPPCSMFTFIEFATDYESAPLVGGQSAEPRCPGYRFSSTRFCREADEVFWARVVVRSDNFVSGFIDE